ncbi:MAG: sulfatase-like hydrolase/transferase [Betaproteobacteria bacterium]|nr:sulfatase-like hydrolase/transferase [Betaproteobacteria bacterium]
MPRTRRLLDVPLVYALATLAIFSATRLGLALWTGTSAVPLSEWLTVFAKGLWFDLVVLAALLAPVWLYEAALPDRWRTTRTHHALRFAWFLLAVFVLLFIAVAEATFWLEFSTRFNFIAVDYLLYTHEVLGNIRESYPVPWIVAGIAAAALLVALAVRPALRRADLAPTSRARRLGYVAAALVLPAAALAVASIEQMGSIGNAYADELAGNGIFTFAAAARRNELDYDKLYATMPQDEADRLLRSLGVERKPLLPNSSLDQVAAREGAEPHISGMPRRPRHVILVTVESLSAEFLGAYGSTKGMTPNLDRLAREGIRFANMYATGTRTVRGLEAVSLGTPPVPGQAIVRRPGNEHLSTMGELLEHQGFATSFVYGGYGMFDNMNAYFDANDYRVVDRRDFPKASIVFENVWGVADESLFDNAIRVVDANAAKGAPTFTHIMTTTNHRPFTYPDGRIPIRSPGGREGGVMYTDWAIGKFVEDARTRPWFDETLFVFIADHCAAVAGKTKLPVAGYRIPLILWAPGLVDPGIYEPVVSQIDLPPSLLDLMRVDGDDYFFGRSVFEVPSGPERAFISNYQSLGYLRDGMLTVLSPGRKVEAFRVDPVTYESTPTPVDPTLAKEAIAYYQTASRAFRQGALKAPPYAEH